eukprot:TRINITY_DN23475_c0_g1_i6.p1 TRINITY_DN23475_c0_g1~~TRINITY_DN23475_c0_g1_i6.p1  ORF type:complete len:317 (+),score=76.70 TRINITY_DN23475_c0_g1_i6:83-952(+)
MLRSLVGSEMCIRDSPNPQPLLSSIASHLWEMLPMQSERECSPRSAVGSESLDMSSGSDPDLYGTPPGTPTELTQLQHQVRVLTQELQHTKNQLQLLRDPDPEPAEDHTTRDRVQELHQALSLMTSSLPRNAPKTCLDTTMYLVLTVGTPMLKVTQNGKIKRVILRLDSDLTQVEWHSIGKIYNSGTRTQSLVRLKYLLLGCRYGRSRLTEEQAGLSFSLVFMDRYLDLIGLNQASFDIWARGLQQLGTLTKQIGTLASSGAPGALKPTKHQRSVSCVGFSQRKPGDTG